MFEVEGGVERERGKREDEMKLCCGDNLSGMGAGYGGGGNW